MLLRNAQTDPPEAGRMELRQVPSVGAGEQLTRSWSEALRGFSGGIPWCDRSFDLDSAVLLESWR